MEVAKKRSVCVCGTGSASHVFVAILAQRFDVTVLTRKSAKDSHSGFVAALQEEGSIRCKDCSDPNAPIEYSGCPSAVSSDPADVVTHADYVVISLPTFAVRDVFERIASHLKPGATVFVMPGQGGVDFLARACLGDAISNRGVTIAGVLPMPFNCRIEEFGRSVLLHSSKHSYDVATLPSSHAMSAGIILGELLGVAPSCVKTLPSFVAMALHASNPNLHPGRMYALFKSGGVLPANPFFYKDWDDDASYWCQAISDERKHIWQVICERFPSAGSPDQVPHMLDYIRSIYGAQIKDRSTLTLCISTNDGLKGFRSPMVYASPGRWVLDMESRYFWEDIPEGMCVYKGIADLVQVPTPAIDLIILFMQRLMGKEYIVECPTGLTCLQGKHLSETKAPQAFGIASIEEYLTC